jgi:hypothetical protein
MVLKILDGRRVMVQPRRFQKEHSPRSKLEKQAKTMQNKLPYMRYVPCKEFT